jgi:hypothetical protein
VKPFSFVHVADLRLGYAQYKLDVRREDDSIDQLAEAISRLKAIEQIIAVTHSEVFAEKAAGNTSRKRSWYKQSNN